MKLHKPTRREIVERCIAGGFLVAAIPLASSNLLAMWEQSEAAALQPTPTEVLGPFFRKGAPHATILRAKGDPGFPLRVEGKVVNSRGEKVPEAKIEIWQADHHGRYDVQGYKYRTQLITGPEARYAVETVMPGHYSDRPAQHVHYMITAPGHKTLITQLYFATDPFFEGNPDKHFQKQKIVDNRELIRPVLLFERPGAAHAQVNFDICMEKA